MEFSRGGFRRHDFQLFDGRSVEIEDSFIDDRHNYLFERTFMLFRARKDSFEQDSI